MIPAQFITSVLEEAGNRYLRLDPSALASLGGLHGRVLRLAFTDLDASLYVLPSEAGLRLLADHPGKPDVTLSGRLPAFARLGLGAGNSLFFSGELSISGEVELGHRFQRILQRVDIDWEEQLSRVLGDVAAHQLGNLARSAHAWQRQALDVLGRDFAEYLQEERQDLPQRPHVEAFMHQVDELRAGVDRLEQRIARLLRAEA